MKHACLALGLLAILFSSCIGDAVTLKLQSLEAKPKIESGSLTYSCTPTCYVAKVLFTNKAGTTTYLNQSHWQVVWPAGQSNGLLGFQGANRAAPGASYAVEIMIGQHPEKKSEQPRRLELYDRDAHAPDAAILGRLDLGGA